MGVVRLQSIKNSVSFYLGMAIGAINTVFIYPYAFEDNPEYFGLIQVIIAYSILVATITTVGVPKVFLRFFPEIKSKSQLYFFSLITPLIGFLAALLLYFLFREQLFSIINASDLLKDNFFYIIILVFFIGFFDILTAISRSFLDSTTPVFINEVFLKIYSMSMLFLYWFGFLSFDNFLKIYFFGFFLKFIILFIIQIKNKRISLSYTLASLNLKEILKFGLFVLIGGASVVIVTRMDIMMISSLLDLEQVAFYTIAFFIGNALRIPSKAIVAISTPLLAKAWKEQDFNEINSIYSKSALNLLIVGGVFFTCVWINIDQIFSLLPEKFSAGKFVVFYIGLSQLFNISFGVNTDIIVNSKYYKYDLYTNLFLVVATFLTNYLLIPSSSPLADFGIVGINGAAMATAISILLFNILKLTIIKIKMDLQPFSMNTLKTLFFLFLVYYIVLYLPLTNIPLFDLFYRSVIICLLFIPLVLYFKLSEDLISLFNDFKKSLLSKYSK